MTDTSTKTILVDEMELKEPEDEAAVEAAEAQEEDTLRRLEASLFRAF